MRPLMHGSTSPSKYRCPACSQRPFSAMRAIARRADAEPGSSPSSCSVCSVCSVAVHGCPGSSRGSAGKQAPPAQSPPPQAQNASGEELEALNHRMIQLGARANAAKASVDQIRQQQAASGFGLRQDVAASLSRMEAYMDAAERAVQGQNSHAARKSMDQAEKEIDNLEAFLGR